MINLNVKLQYNVKQCLDYINRLNLEKKLEHITTKLSEIYITDIEKKKALDQLCKIKTEIPKDDLIVYFDKDNKIYYCFTKEELLKLTPYYVNPRDKLRFIDYNFINKISNYYKL